MSPAAVLGGKASFPKVAGGTCAQLPGDWEVWRGAGPPKYAQSRHAEQEKHLRALVRGHARYVAVPRNGVRVRALRCQADRLWHRTLCRRSQTKHPS
jgi:hypothetical protein